MTSKPNPIDIHVGGRIRLRRTLLGLSQEKLGKAIGLTFQQVQKYERGTNRVGSSRLYQIAKVLSVPVSFFFDDMAADPGAAAPQLAEDADPFKANPLANRETLELVRAFQRIADPAVRKRIQDLVKAIAGSGE
ncbi:MAG TPA: helix-turn-helix transcriptional regulator [Alphaproteobacteria bacterium]